MSGYLISCPNCSRDVFVLKKLIFDPSIKCTFCSRSLKSDESQARFRAVCPDGHISITSCVTGLLRFLPFTSDIINEYCTCKKRLIISKYNCEEIASLSSNKGLVIDLAELSLARHQGNQKNLKWSAHSNMSKSPLQLPPPFLLVPIVARNGTTVMQSVPNPAYLSALARLQGNSLSNKTIANPKDNPLNIPPPVASTMPYIAPPYIPTPNCTIQ